MGQPHDANLRGTDAFLIQNICKKLRPNKLRWRTHIAHPYLAGLPPIDTPAFPHGDDRISFQGEHQRRRHSSAADAGEIADVGLKIVPVAGVVRSDDAVDPTLAHQRADDLIATVAFSQSEALFR